ncbi:unnamed protein product [Rhizophagus irregularis]|nr:unnamed protein product [Rhizophagus irregularis]
MEKPSFDRIFRRTGKFQDSFGWASVFRRTGKFQRFDLVGFRRKENQETKIRKIWRASEERKTKKPRFVRSGGIPKNENPKIKIRSGGLPKNGKRRTFKIRSGGFLSFQGMEKTKDSFQWVSKKSRFL